jgi:hypothetical protein
MLTSDLSWTDWQALHWESIVCSLRQTNKDHSVLAHVVRVGDMFTVGFNLSSLYATEPPVFSTIEDAKAYTCMTCLLILKEN